MLAFDHLAISAATLAEGTAAVEAALGTTLAGGGQHAHMATHNRLLGLGDLYLEVIAIDPLAPKPGWPRWFDLDNFTGPPRLTNWVACTDDLAMALALAPPGTGNPVALSRGNYHWKMAVPANGQLPFHGAFPALIEWQGPHHPTQALPESGIRLTLLEIANPDALALRATLTLTDPRIQIVPGREKTLRATFSTRHGPRHLA